MGSTRLPGKILEDLAGATVLEWVIRRVARASRISRVVVATTVQPQDDRLAEFCASKGWSCYRGSEDDVLDRYFDAAREYGSTAVVRVTADCPLIDAEIVDRVVEQLFRSPPADYASNTLEPRTYPRGLDVEAFTYAALERAWREDHSPWREHVTPYLYRHPELFSLRSVRNERDLSGLRWTVDTPEDLACVRSLVERVTSPYAGWEEFLEIVERHPELATINQGVMQKRID
jgi:spore coat polysaccharide biosynthesis protein SpsF